MESAAAVRWKARKIRSIAPWARVCLPCNGLQSVFVVTLVRFLLRRGTTSSHSPGLETRGLSELTDSGNETGQYPGIRPNKRNTEIVLIASGLSHDKE